MSSHGFTFKQFYLNHDRCAMKVGTDGVLLGAWTPLGKARRILDLGTGSGLVALMLAQRVLAQRSADGVQPVEIVGLELDEEAANQAAENVAISPWPNTVLIEQGAIQAYQAPAFDLIVSNPPYFAPGQQFTSQARANARHTGSLGVAELFAHAQRLSAVEGRLALVLPYQALELALSEAQLHGWHLVEQVAVHTKANKPALRSLLLFSRKPAAVNRRKLVINGAEGGYQAEYVELVRSFYLKM